MKVCLIMIKFLKANTKKGINKKIKLFNTKNLKILNQNNLSENMNDFYLNKNSKSHKILKERM